MHCTLRWILHNTERLRRVEIVQHPASCIVALILKTHFSLASCLIVVPSLDSMYCCNMSVGFSPYIFAFVRNKNFKKLNTDKHVESYETVCNKTRLSSFLVHLTILIVHVLLFCVFILWRSCRRWPTSEGKNPHNAIM